MKNRIITLQEENSLPDWSVYSFIMVVCEKLLFSRALDRNSDLISNKFSCGQTL